MKQTILLCIIMGMVTGCGEKKVSKKPDSIRREAEKIRRYIYQNRPPPLKDLPAEIQLTVTDFGAHPDDGMDDLPGLEAAIKQAINLGVPAEVLMPQGRYLLSPDNKEPDHCLKIIRAENMIINGSGSEIIVKNPLMGFLEIGYSKNIIVKDLFIDYDPLPFTQGYVEAVHSDDGSFDLRIAAGFPELDMPHFVNTKPNMNWRDCASWGMLRDPEIPTRLKAGCPNVFFARTIEKPGEHLYRISLEPASHIQYFEKGDKYVHLARYEQIEANFIYTHRCEQVTFMNIENYTSVSWNYTNRHTSLFNAINCRVVIKGRRWHTLDSDGIGTAGGRYGPWIEDCVFESISDDCFVLAAGRLYIRESAGDKKLGMFDIDPYSVREGDNIMFYNPRLGVPLIEAKVLQVDYEKGIVTFDKALPKMQAGQGKPNDVGINKSTGNPYFIIKNNVVKDSRRNAVRMTNGLSYGIFEGNLFEGNEDPPLTIWSDVNWNLPQEIRDKVTREYEAADFTQFDNEYVDCEHLLIMGNTFRECSFNNPNGNLFLTMNRTGNQPARWQAIKDIYVLDNTFENWSGKQAIRIQCAQRVYIQDNLFLNQNNPYRVNQPDAIISLFNCADIHAYHNQAQDDRKIGRFMIAEEVSNLVDEHNQLK